MTLIKTPVPNAHIVAKNHKDTASLQVSDILITSETNLFDIGN